jgi:hypothetical protein
MCDFAETNSGVVFWPRETIRIWDGRPITDPIAHRTGRHKAQKLFAVFRANPVFVR